jgi:hypothetical protein
MDRREEQAHQKNAYARDLQAQIDEKDLEREWVAIDGKMYRVPYKIIKRVVFTNIDKKDFIDQEHAARLQYRLMLQEAIIKATVDYLRNRITVIYNPKEADNHKEKMDITEIIEFLNKEGVHVSKDGMELEDYDYYKNFYSYAYNPTRIREHAPYGWDMKRWKEMKPEWEKKMQNGEKAKMDKFHAWQEEYMKEMEKAKNQSGDTKSTQ